MNMILNNIRVAGNVLLHSVRTATFCWALIGIVAAISVIRGMIKKKSDKKQNNNYSLEGMSIGMCFGLLFGTMLEGYIGVGISLGVIIWFVTGMLIPVKKENGDK